MVKTAKQVASTFCCHLPPPLSSQAYFFTIPKYLLIVFSVLDVFRKKRSNFYLGESAGQGQRRRRAQKVMGAVTSAPRKSDLGSTGHLCFPEWREYHFQPIKSRCELEGCSENSVSRQYICGVSASLNCTVPQRLEWFGYCFFKFYFIFKSTNLTI